jgi:diaminopimelate epimerase
MRPKFQPGAAKRLCQGGTLTRDPDLASAPLRFWKGQALGNDYIVIDTAEAPPAGVVRAFCDRHRGIGSDGLLVADTAAEPVSLRIFNPDGREAEKSGNGLRIFGAWLHARGLVDAAGFQVSLPGERVAMRVEGVDADGTRSLRVDMGRASFRAGAVHYDAAAPDAEVSDAELRVGADTVRINLVSLGNPHCVVFADPLDMAAFRRLAPRIQALPVFRQGINVQFARVDGPAVLDAVIWERGVGETLASGSSACAVVAAAVRSGRVEGDRFRVRMPGGSVDVEVDPDWSVRLAGPAQIVFEGSVPAGVLQGWSRAGLRS